MPLSYDLFHRYEAAIRSLPPDRPLTKHELLVDDFLLHRDGKLGVYYAPHNEYINTRAKIVIVGITPGWTQMELAFRKARQYLEEGLSAEEVCKRVKSAARFAGTMRHHLTSMLDALGLHRYLRLPSCGHLFMGEGEELVHTTSMLRYPVFVDEKNYNGHSPALLANPFLRQTAIAYIKSELQLFRNPLLIPLGKTVEAVLRIVAADGMLDPGQCLWGFPHPSGANGHRLDQFAQAKSAMSETLAAFNRRHPFWPGAERER